jgi:hypothetical protein
MPLRFTAAAKATTVAAANTSSSGATPSFSYALGGSGYLSSTFDPSTIGTGDITVSCWVRIPSQPSGTDYVWILGNDNLDDSLALRIRSSKLEAFGRVGTTGEVEVAAANPMLNDFWHHVVVTRTGTTIELFVNGTSNNSATNAEAAADLSDGETWFGYYAGVANFTGDIANIEIRSGIATDSEIYNNFRSNTAYTTGTAQTVEITNNGATASNSPIPLAWGNQHSFYFDGANDDIDLGSISSLNSASQFSISMWFRGSEDNSIGNMFGAWGAIANNNIGLSPNYDLDIFYFVVRSGSAAASLQVNSMSTYAPADEWNHVLAVFDNGDRYVYINGVLRASDTGVAPATTSASCGDNVSIGQRENAYYEGFIDEFRYYADTALDADDATTLYNADTPIDSTLSPSYYLHEGSGADWSGNNVLATLQSGAVPSSDVPVLTIPDWVSEHSLDLNGSSQYGVADDHDDLTFNTGGTDDAFSGGCWVKMDDATNFVIFDKTVEYTFYVDSSDKLALVLATDASNYLYTRTTSTVTSHEGSWVYLSFAYDGSETHGGITLYVNGVSQSTEDQGSGTYTGMTNTSATLRLGYDGTNYADGHASNVSIWTAEVDADAMTKLAIEPIDIMSADGDYDYQGNVEAFLPLETGFGPFVIDYSGNGHHATAPSGALPTWTTDIPPDTRSIDLDGVDDIVVVSDNDVFSFGDGVSDSAFSVVIICKMDDDDRFRAINKSGASNREWAIGTNSSGQPYFQLWSGGGSTVQLNVTHNGGGFSSDQGLWVMYAGTYDGSGNVSGLYMYRNGVDVSDTRLSIGGSYVAMSNTAQDVQIGKGYGNIVGHGKIFTAGIWNNVLTAAELVELWNGGNPIRFNEDSGNYTSSSDLIEEWPMNEGGGNTAAGVNGYDATLTPTGEPLWTLDVPNA